LAEVFASNIFGRPFENAFVEYTIIQMAPTASHLQPVRHGSPRTAPVSPETS
jgi:hypothetical protein